MNKYAQVKGGKIIYFYQTDLSIGELTSIFSPKTFWVDVTDKECGLGWEVSYNSDCEMVLTAPPAPTTPTLEVLRQRKIAELKYQRDVAEVQPIEYNGNLYDYDEKARDRINVAIAALGDTGSISWTTADNKEVTVTGVDLRSVLIEVAKRSIALHKAYRAAREKVLNATTKEEVEQVVLNE